METLIEPHSIEARQPRDVSECIETCALLEDYSSQVRQRALARCGLAGVCSGEKQGLVMPRICGQDVRTRIDLQLAADNLAKTGE